MEELTITHPIRLAGDGRISCECPEDVTISLKELRGILKAVSSGATVWSNGTIKITVD